MNDPVYSIIIPHYNCPDLLTRCLDSIPVREDIQVLVIDDCSPGADKYKELYPALSRPYLEFYNTPFGGSAGRARNIGLDHAKGKWIVCVDADDLLVPEAAEILDACKDRTEDIIFLNYSVVKSDDLSTPGKRSWYRDYFKQYVVDGKEDNLRYRFDSLAGKLISRRLISEHGIRFDETRYSNDAGFSLKCGTYAKTVAVIDKVLYIVAERDGSLAASQFSGAKPSAEEYAQRLEVGLSNCRFADGHGIHAGLMPTYYACSFYNDWPGEYKQFFRSVIARQYPQYALRLFLGVLFITVKRRLKK